MATRSGAQLPAPVAAGARLVAAALVATMAGIHIHLWSSGYRHVPVIGILFLVNGIAGISLASALVVVPSRLLGVVAATATLFTIGTLLALVLSLTTGLFGFRELTGAPFLSDSLIVESAGTVVTGALAAVCALGRRPRLVEAGGSPDLGAARSPRQRHRRRGWGLR